MSTSVPQLSIQTFLNPFELYTDSREHGYEGPSRHVRHGRVTPPGGGSVAKSGDGTRCAVTGKESLRILRVSTPSQPTATEHKSTTGRGGHRIDASRNFWEGSGLKIDSASTDIAWAHGIFSNKILTSARNGELIMWDLNKSGATKYERRTKDHIRSIHKMAVSARVDSYCITGSADGDMRVWDLRDISKSIMRVHHPTSVRSLVFSPSVWQPLEAVVGLDNGSIYRWDLRYGQRGQLDKLPVAHTASVTALDWCYTGSQVSPSIGLTGGQTEPASNGMGWLVSGGLDRCVKVWDLTSPAAKAHIPQKPTYTLHPSSAVRRIAWRPGYECEIAIVFNTDYAMPAADTSQPTLGPNPSESKPGLLTRVSSGLGLDSLMRSGGTGEKISMTTATGPESRPSNSGQMRNLGDAIEIWDVRRGWIAKWSVTGSANEGGVTDISFNDSHALWTQNTSGAFSQIDLRETTKPLDAIPRVATTWDATGSMAFVVDDSEQEQWEVPYDDIGPKKLESAELRSKPALKALGDPPVRLSSQAIATYTPDSHAESGNLDLETFTTLARRYIFEGRDKKDICLYNSGVALASGNATAAQVWLLLGACLAQYLPKTALSVPTTKAKKVPTPLMPSQPHSQTQLPSQPSTAMGGYTFPGPSSSSSRNIDAISPPLGDRDGSQAASSSSTPGTRRSTGDSISVSLSSSSKLSRFGPIPPINSPSSTHSRSRSRLGTPMSSTASSPGHLPTGLPPITPRRASFFDRRHSINLGTPGMGMMRRPSLPVTPARSGSLASSPSDRNTPSSLSLRNVGEGVLDESDSDPPSNEEDGDDESGEGEETAGAYSSDDERRGGPLRFAVSSALNGSRAFPAPSPLSRVAGRQSWTEDEYDDTEVARSRLRSDEDDIHDDDGYMPSPQSTDTDSSSSSGPHSNPNTSHRGARKTKTKLRNSAHHHLTRSRSSTVAALPAPLKALVHQDSRSSIRTVIASPAGTGTPFRDREHARREENHRSEMEYHPQSHDTRTSANHGRSKSQAISEHIAGSVNKAHSIHISQPAKQEHVPVKNTQLTERRIESITIEEKRFRETTLAALRDALEEFSDEGNVQMCAMLALVAPSELKISPLQVERFLDSYIEFLTRLRLYTCAAYLRKYCETEEIRKSTMLETIIYTSCGKCRKPLMLPAGSFNGKSVTKGAFSYCLGCKASAMKCSICRLPVRTLLFQCSICHHGGHQACYRQYYLQKPMIDLPSSCQPVSNDKRGRPPLRKAPSSVIEDDSSTTVSTSTDTSSSQTDTNSTATTNSTAENSAAQSPVQRNSMTLVGHPCATGCGHYCWAANGNGEI